MKLSKIKQLLEAEIKTKEVTEDIDIKSACGSDLMSDVLAFVKEQGILLTGLVNPQVRVIVFVRGKEPDDDMIQLADEKGIVLLTTQRAMYVACGLLYSNGLVPDNRV